MEPDDIKDLATVKAEVIGISDNIVEIKNWIRESTELSRQTQETRASNHSAIMERFARVETKQDAFKEYQDKCDIDRLKITKQVRDIEDSENIRAGRSGIINVIIATVTSAIVGLGIAFMEKH